MLNHRKLFVYIHWIMMATMMQAAPLIDSKDLYNLAAIKQQIHNIQTEDIIFDAFVDASKQATLQRRGILIRRQDPIGTVVICHGYLGCKRDSLALKHLFPNYNVLVFDFRAHGDDRNGQISTIGRDEAFDVIGAVHTVKSDPVMADKPIIAFGFSMGAVSAIQAQSHDDTLFDAMILDCPFDSTDDAMRRGLDEKMQVTLFGKKFTIPGKQFLLDHMYDDSAQAITQFLFQAITKLDGKTITTKFVQVRPVDAVKKITVPCFFIHCENDKKVPIYAVEQLYHNKPGFKRLWITQGKWHFGSYHNNPELYWYKVNKFLTKLQEQDIADREQEKVCDHRTTVTITHDNTMVISENKSSVARRMKNKKSRPYLWLNWCKKAKFELTQPSLRLWRAN
ncbi:MAG: alpha/beta fold hydrolase [Candidatus Chromulinivorax sp.]|nr:alpha/beta fold hydrolase [Candidatus Chromulinivorax sp.]